MHMLLLVGISVGFALSVLTSNNFYSEKTFTSSVNHWECVELKSERCKNLIAQASDLPWSGGQQFHGSGSGSSSSQSLQNRVERFFGSVVNAISNFFRLFF